MYGPKLLQFAFTHLLTVFQQRGEKNRKIINLDLSGLRGNLFTTVYFFLINILKICHNLRKCSKTNTILSLTDPCPTPVDVTCCMSPDTCH